MVRAIYGGDSPAQSALRSLQIQAMLYAYALPILIRLWRNQMPKGYNDKAIDGMLTFLEGCFEVILQEVKNGKSPEQAMQEELDEIRSRLESDKTVKIGRAHV